MIELKNSLSFVFSPFLWYNIDNWQCQILWKESDNMSTSTSGLKAVILSFPLNPRKITDKLLSDIARINLVDPTAVYGSNMRLALNSSTRVKLYLPNFSTDGFSATFSVSGDMPEERLTRLINVYGLAASLKMFDFVHYVAGTHLIVCISIASTLDNIANQKGLQALNDLQNFLEVQGPTMHHK